VEGTLVQGLGEQHAAALLQQFHRALGLPGLDCPGGSVAGQRGELAKVLFLVLAPQPLPGHRSSRLTAAAPGYRLSRLARLRRPFLRGEGVLDIEDPGLVEGLVADLDAPLFQDGRHLYVSNRGHDSLTVYDVGAEGRLTPRRTPCVRSGCGPPPGFSSRLPGAGLRWDNAACSNGAACVRE